MAELTNYQKMFEKATYTGKPDKTKSLSAWHERTITTRRALMEIKAEYKKDLDKLRGIYSDKVFDEKRQKSDSEYAAVLEIAKQKIATDLDATLEGKRARFDECNNAPSAESVRLLNVLSMRDKLTPAEIASVSGKFGGNIQALRVLRDIAKRSGVCFPDIGNPEVFDEQITIARQFATEMIGSLDTDHAELTYRQRVFWDAPKTGEARHFFLVLDEQGFTTQQITDFTTEQERQEAAAKVGVGNTEPGEVWAEVKAFGGESIFAIAEQFHTTVKAIKEANPGKDFDRIYAGDRFYVPATKFSFRPGGTSVQPKQVKAVPKPVFAELHGPNGESIGDDIDITQERGMK